MILLQKLKLNLPSSVLLITHRKDCTWCNYRRKTQYITLQYLVCLIFQFSVAWSRTWPNVPSPPRVWCVTLSVALQPCFFFFRSSLLQSHLFAPPFFKTCFCCDIITVLFMQAIIYWLWSIANRNMSYFLDCPMDNVDVIKKIPKTQIHTSETGQCCLISLNFPLLLLTCQPCMTDINMYKVTVVATNIKINLKEREPKSREPPVRTCTV